MKSSKRRLATLSIAVLIGIAYSASAQEPLSTFAFEGVITGFSSIQTTEDGVSGPLETRDGRVLVFAPGDPFTGTLEFFNNPDPFFPPFLGTFLITVRGENFGTAGLVTRSSGGTPNAIGIQSIDGIGTSPFELVDTHAHAEFFLTRSVNFPIEVPSLEDFLGTGTIGIDGNDRFPFDVARFSLTGNITNVRAVPESGPGMLLISVVLASLFLARQRWGSASLK